jgi:twitching motility protein PilT
MAFDIDAALHYLVETEGSDLHVKVPSPPSVRIHGELQPIKGAEGLKPEDTEAALNAILTDEAKREEFAEEGEVDFSYAIPGLSRFRVNAFRQRGSVSIALRAIPFNIRSIDELGLPPVIRDLAEEQRGIVLLTGTTGSGKSTTLAAIVDHVNRTRSSHIVTIEDPIEFLHQDQQSIVNQREVGLDTESFQQALRRALRQDPDTILIGELRDAETAHTALQAAESGHLVFSTLHTIDSAETISRLVEYFPEGKQQQIRSILAGVLRGVISQRLLPRVDSGRVAVVEVMVNNARIADLIREGRPDEIGDAIAEGEYFDMQTFQQALIAKVIEGAIDADSAADASSNKHDFLVALERALKVQELELPESRPESQPDAPAGGLRVAQTA